MKNLVVKKNREIDEVLLDKVFEFDRTIFPVDSDYSLPDDYLKRMYFSSKDGLFILLDDDNVVGYVNCIFISDEAKNNYQENKKFLELENVGFKYGDNNMYLYTLALNEKYRHTDAIKILMRDFTKWLDEEIKKGKRIKSCISEAVTEDGIRALLAMGMKPQDVDSEGLGIYYSPDFLNSYIKKMNKNI